MNWYKKAQEMNVLDKVEEFDPETHNINYLDIGHKAYFEEVKNPKKNKEYLWVYFNDELLIEKSNYYIAHRDAFPQIDEWENLFYGRFDSSSGKLSLGIPRYKTKLLDYSIPRKLMLKLMNKFKIRKIYKFSERKNEKII